MIGASFRGVPYYVENQTRSGGRRLAVHEFPGSDAAVVDDLGRQAGRFADEGYLIGDQIRADIVQLLAALQDTSGPGELIHPYHGTRDVICASVSVRTSREEGRMARFAIEYVEPVGPGTSPVAAPDRAEEVKVATDEAQTAAVAELETTYDVDGPNYSKTSLSADVTAVVTSLRDELRDVLANAQERAIWTADLNGLLAESTTIIDTPTDIVSRLDRTVAKITLSSVASVEALLVVSDIPEQPIAVGDTATRVKERANQAALSALLRRWVLFQASRIANTATYVSRSQAVTIADRIATRLQSQAANATDESYIALVTLRAAVQSAIPGPRVLATAKTLTITSATPSIALAYRLYGDLSNELDIVDRNNSVHPAFLVGSIEVLSV